MADELPNLDLFIKVVGMTGSSHDGEALAAIRRANTLLQKWGWDWDRLLRAKVRVVADPFASIETPPVRPQQAGTAPPQPKPWAAPPYRPAPPRPPQRPRYQQRRPSKPAPSIYDI